MGRQQPTRPLERPFAVKRRESSLLFRQILPVHVFPSIVSGAQTSLASLASLMDANPTEMLHEAHIVSLSLQRLPHLLSMQLGLPLLL